ncbi:bacteriorhodopsin, partial [Geodermatophilus sp. SYSU D00758]
MELLSVGEVAARLGVSPSAVRMWGTRYGLVASARSAGGHRRYTPEDVALLQAVHEAVLSGTDPAAAAAAARGLGQAADDERRNGRRRAGAGGAGLAVPGAGRGARGLARAAARLDEMRAEDAVLAALRASGTLAAWDEVVRIFDNFRESYPPGETIDSPHVLSNVAFNEVYRYVDWLLTVPPLLIETVAVMALAKSDARRLLWKLVPASALMIVLGYPGEITTEVGPRLLWGTLSTIPFIYLLWVLFVELTRSIDRQPPQVQHTIRMLRLALVGLWGVYPIAYLLPLLGGDFFGGADGFVLRQAGYGIADILAKAAYGLAIYKVARVKSALEDPAYDDDHAAPGPGDGSAARPAAGRPAVRRPADRLPGV